MVVGSAVGSRLVGGLEGRQGGWNLSLGCIVGRFCRGGVAALVSSVGGVPGNVAALVGC
jgi:hypothetical protein